MFKVVVVVDEENGLLRIDLGLNTFEVMVLIYAIN
jgi:hypothetical protein